MDFGGGTKAASAELGSELFYDPFAERIKQPDKLDLKLRKVDPRAAGGGGGGGGGAGGGDDDGGGGDDEDEEDDDFAEEEDCGGVPPVDLLERIIGYELVSFDAISVPPPPYEPDDQQQQPPEAGGEKPDSSEVDGKGKAAADAPKMVVVKEMETKLTEAQVRAALLSYVADRCCYGTSAAKNMRVSRMEYLPAYHYELQTFTEKRETAWTHAPLKSSFDTGHFSGPSDCDSKTRAGGAFDGFGGGGGGGHGGHHATGGGAGSRACASSSSASGIPPPLPWEIEEAPGQAFKDEVRLVEVPRTESIKTCHRCRGTGGVSCRDCSGKGWSRCLHCHGDGYVHDSSGHKERCFYCQHSKHGHGRQDCHKCSSKGRVHCQTCEGHGQIRCFIQLSITWKVHTAEHILEKLDLPAHLVRDVSGQVAFEEEAIRVGPVDLDKAFRSSSVPDPQQQQQQQDSVQSHQPDDRSALIKKASSDLVTRHINEFSADQRVVRQRHQVRVVPVTKVIYDWKHKPHNFYVYGYENKVHLPNYPQKCCWGCFIL